MNGKLNARLRNIIRKSVFDWLRRLEFNDVYTVNLRQCAQHVFEELARIDELSSQPPADVPLEELHRQHVSQNIVNFITQVFWNLHLQGILAPSPAWVSTGNSVFNDGYKNVSASLRLTE